jgi:hypothetical protein
MPSSTPASSTIPPDANRAPGSVIRPASLSCSTKAATDTSPSEPTLEPRAEQTRGAGSSDTAKGMKAQSCDGMPVFTMAPAKWWPL